MEVSAATIMNVLLSYEHKCKESEGHAEKHEATEHKNG